MIFTNSIQLLSSVQSTLNPKTEELKLIATQARIDMEKFFGGKVYLKVWVKIKSGWADDLRALKTLGYE